MTRYLGPLWVFVFGSMVALVAFLFLGAIGDAADATHTATANMHSVFWNFDWVSSGTTVKWLVFLFIELLTLLATGVAFLRVR